MIHLTVIGAGPAYSDRPGAAGACYLLRADGDALLLDLGQGAFPGLVRRIEPSRLLAVVVSHLHPDHFVDLVPLRHYLRYQRTPPERVRVLAPRALPERLDGLHGTQGFGSAVLEVLQDADCLTPVERLGWPDKFVEHGSSVEVLRAAYGLSTDDLVRRIKDRWRRLGTAAVEAEA